MLFQYAYHYLFLRRVFGYILCSIFYVCFLSVFYTYLFKVDRHVDLLEVAQETDGFSGSDLKEMCRDAALLCVREYVNSTSEERYVCIELISNIYQILLVFKLFYTNSVYGIKVKLELTISPTLFIVFF